MCVFHRLWVYLLIGLFYSQSVSAEGVTVPIFTFSQVWQSLITLGNKKNTHYEPHFVKQNSSTGKHYIVGVHPLHNPKRLFEVYLPIIDLFNAQIPEATFELEASHNYEEFDKKLYTGHFDFALPNPYQTINALKKGYHVFAKMGDDKNFCGIILIRKDSSIKHISDLKGKVIAYPAPTALAATLMPQYYLYTHGLDINKEVENRYVGSQESSIMNVLNGDVAAGATWPVPWQSFQQKNPALAAQLEIKWQTEALINNSWVARENISSEMIAKVSHILLNLLHSPQGQAILAEIPISTFEAANDATYEPVNTFISRFNKNVHPLD